MYRLSWQSWGWAAVGVVFAGVSVGVITSTLIVQTNAAVASKFGLTDLIGSDVVTTVDITGVANAAYTSAALGAAQKYGAVLATLSGMDAANGGNMQTTIDGLTTGITMAGSTATLSNAMVDAFMLGARRASATTSGTAASSLTAIISDLIATQTGASIWINQIATDCVIGAGEQNATISGTTVAGASVNISLGGNVRAATVVGTDWSYVLTGADIAAMGQGGELITATASLGDATMTAARGVVVLDTPAPTLSITSNVSALKTGETATITFTFSEATSNFVVGDITTSSGSVSNFTSVSSTVYTATFTPSASLASGSASITVASGNYTDAAGNTGGAGTTPTISIDTLAPTAVLSAATDNVGSVTGVVASGGVTDDTVLVLSGTNEASATVNVYNGSTLLGGSHDLGHDLELQRHGRQRHDLHLQRQRDGCGGQRQCSDIELHHYG